MANDVTVAGDDEDHELYTWSTAQARVEDVWNVKPEVMDPEAAGEEEEERLLLLSGLDLLHLHSSPQRRILFYAAQPSGCGINDDEKARQRREEWQGDMVGRLKSSLARALCHFYPLAGELVVDGCRSYYAIDCRKISRLGGVLFIVCASGGPLLPLASTGFRPRPFFDRLAPQLLLPDAGAGASPPLLSIQVTKFSCGGMAVGFANHSGVADGHSMWFFMNSWAKMARGESLHMLPFHDRTFFTVDAESRRRPVGGLQRWQRRISATVASPRPLEERLFHFSSRSIADLVRSAGDHAGMPREFNAYEVVCGHLWKHITRARLGGDEAAGERRMDIPAQLMVMGDMRFRVEPPLPSSYFGNAAMTAVTEASVGDVVEEPLGEVAFRIHEACKSCNEPNMWAMLLLLQEEGQGDGGGALKVSVVSSHKYDVYGVDFGWGKPRAVRTAGAGAESEDGRVVLFKAAPADPHQEEDARSGHPAGMDVCVTLESKTMRRLVGDSHFLAAATLV